MLVQKCKSTYLMDKVIKQMTTKIIALLVISFFVENAYSGFGIDITIPLPNAPNIGGKIAEAIDHGLKELSGKAAADRTNEARAQAREAQGDLERAKSLLADKKEQQEKIDRSIEMVKQQQAALRNEVKVSVDRIANQLASTLLVFDSINNDHMEIEKLSADLNVRLAEFKKHFNELYFSKKNLVEQFGPQDDRVVSLYLLQILAEMELQNGKVKDNRDILEIYRSSVSLVGKNYQSLQNITRQQLDQTRDVLDNHLNGQISKRIESVKEKSAIVQSKAKPMISDLGELLKSIRTLTLK